MDENGPTADAEEAGAALAVTPAREGYPLSPASATVVPWEMPAEHRGHEMAAGGGAPSAREMMGHGGAAGMSMDSMVRDMRNRFLVAATFSVPILLWSPIGRNVMGSLVLDLLRRRGRRPACHRYVPRRRDCRCQHRLMGGLRRRQRAARAHLRDDRRHPRPAVRPGRRGAGRFLVPFLDLGIAQDPCSTRPRPRGRTSCPATEASASYQRRAHARLPSDRSVADRTGPACRRHCRRWPAVPLQHAGRQRLSATLLLPPGGI